MRTSPKSARGWGCAIGRPQRGHRIVECLLTPLRAVKRPPVHEHLIALGARQLSGPRTRDVDVPVLEALATLACALCTAGGRGRHEQRKERQCDRAGATCRSPRPPYAISRRGNAGAQCVMAVLVQIFASHATAPESVHP